MYLVERRPGKEVLYQSPAELAAAIDRGEVDARSRIYHRATSTWISITLHPHFRAKAAERSRDPLPPLARKSWTFFPAEARSGGQFEDAADAIPDPGPSDGQHEGESKPQPRRRARRFGALSRFLHG
jgi:hypothetical protein